MTRTCTSVLAASLCFSIAACDIEGEDVALFNNINELVIVGRNADADHFDSINTKMLVHLHRSDGFHDVPSARLSLGWYRVDSQGNHVPMAETSRTFYDAVSEGDYYALAFVDLNRDSELSRGEPVDVWTDSYGEPKVIRVREESRWKLVFDFARPARYRHHLP